jgi:hypothetical protein
VDVVYYKLSTTPTGITPTGVSDYYCKSVTMNTAPNPMLVGAPYHFYFGLRKGKTALNLFIDKYIFNNEE